MKERLKKIRKECGMNQEQFCTILGITRSGLSEIESGRRNVTEKHIKLLCSGTVNGKQINENWLRTGEGKMFIEVERDVQISRFVGDALKDEEDSFKKRLIHMLASLDESEWDLLEKMVEKMQEKRD